MFELDKEAQNLRKQLDAFHGSTEFGDNLLRSAQDLTIDDFDSEPGVFVNDEIRLQFFKKEAEDFITDELAAWEGKNRGYEYWPNNAASLRFDEEIYRLLDERRRQEYTPVMSDRGCEGADISNSSEHRSAMRP